MSNVLIFLLIIVLGTALGLGAHYLVHGRRAAKQAVPQEEAAAQEAAAAREKLQAQMAGAFEHEKEAAADVSAIPEQDLQRIEAAFAKFKEAVEGWEAKLQQAEFTPEEVHAIEVEQRKFHMYVDKVFYEKQQAAVASDEWRKWTDAFGGLFERHAALIALPEPEIEEEDDEDEAPLFAPLTPQTEAADTAEANQAAQETAAASESETEPAAESESEHTAASANTGEPHHIQTASTDAEKKTAEKTESAAVNAETEQREPAGASTGRPSEIMADAQIFSPEFLRESTPYPLDEQGLKGKERDLYEYAHRRNLSKREAGDRYERYIGYLYERAGWPVEYYGLTEGVANSNRGIDLICYGADATHFVQTKHWTEGVVAKTNIRNVIDRVAKNAQQLAEKRPVSGRIVPVLVVKPELAAEYFDYAAEQGVRLFHDVSVQLYPQVKCTTGKRGSRKYFVPFLKEKTAEKVQEMLEGAWEPYDLVRMDTASGDVHVHTLAEAEALGYKYSTRP